MRLMEQQTLLVSHLASGCQCAKIPKYEVVTGPAGVVDDVIIVVVVVVAVAVDVVGVDVVVVIVIASNQLT